MRNLILPLGVALLMAGPADAQRAARRQAARADDNAPSAQQLDAIRADVGRRNLRYTVGQTGVLGRPRAQLLGDSDDPGMPAAARRAVNGRASQLLAIDEEARRAFLQASPENARVLPEIEAFAGCNPGAKAFSWRAKGKVTPLHVQSCGNCWAFAASNAYEASYKIRNGSTVDVSEQYVNDCARADDGEDAGSCGGGLAAKALQHYVKTGGTNESAIPYEGQNQACTNPATPRDAVAWGFADPDADHPSKAKIKAAICAHGPVTTRMRVVSGNIFAYTGGVYEESVASDDAGGGHAVVIVGWDDDKDAWLIKNSWADWGDDGFGWIAYGSNRIGRQSAWIHAKHPRLVLSAAQVARRRALLAR